MINADHPSDAILVERERGTDTIRWVVRMRGYCLNRQGEWEIEPPFSSRDGDFYRRCRWTHPDDALQAAAAAFRDSETHRGAGSTGPLADDQH